jgi:SNF2 family DNA or RNA helicase
MKNTIFTNFLEKRRMLRILEATTSPSYHQKSHKFKKYKPNDKQLDILRQIHVKSQDSSFTGCCLSLPMGSGKTFISLELIRTQYNNDISLVICSKTLITSWINEIDKFYNPGIIRYEVYHRDYQKNMSDWTPKPDTNLVLVTPGVIKKSYTDDVMVRFSTLKKGQFVNEKTYTIPHVPFSNVGSGSGYFHSVKWDAIFIDEGHNYTNIPTITSQAIASLCGSHRFFLSGTVFQEADMNRVLGFFLLLNLEFPRCFTDCKQYIYDIDFKGIQQFCVSVPINNSDKHNNTSIDDDNTDTSDEISDVGNITLKREIVKYKLSKEEAVCYAMFKKIIHDLYINYTRKKKFDKQTRRKIGGSLLSMITYLRQVLVVPQIPIAKLLLSAGTEEAKTQDGETTTTTDHKHKEEKDDGRIVAINNVLTKYKLTDWITNKNSYISTRLKKCMEILNNHTTEKVLIFGCFVSCLEYLRWICANFINRPLFILTSTTNIKKRTELLDDFRQSKNGILLLTYSIGSEGLNLQEANVIIHLDLYWNKGKENQALSRIYRKGQKSRVVYQYIIISNTQIEKTMLKKQEDKLNIISDINNGCVENFNVSQFNIRSINRILQNDIMVH